MSDIRVLVVGNSHVAALKRAAADLPADFGVLYAFINLNAARLRDVPSGYGPNEIGSAEKLIDDFQPDAIVSCIGGNAHTIIGLLEHPQPFDFVYPGDDAFPVDPERQIVPCSSVQQLLEAAMVEELQALAMLGKNYSKPRIHLESPPINPSEQHIRNHPGAFAALMDQRGVAPARLRHKLWRLHSDIVRRVCHENDIQFVPVPAEVQDSHGMLNERAWNPDPTHGNEWYGRRVLVQLKNHVSGNMI